MAVRAGPAVPGALHRRRDRSGGAVGHRRRLDRGHPARPGRGTSSPATWSRVTLVAPDGGKSLSGVVYDYCDEQRHSARVELRSEDVQDLLDGPGADAAGGRPTGTSPPTCDPLAGSAPGRSSCCRSGSAASWSASWPWATAAPPLPGRSSSCRSVGWPIRWRWRWPTRGCWSRSSRWPTSTA